MNTHTPSDIHDKYVPEKSFCVVARVHLPAARQPLLPKRQLHHVDSSNSSQLTSISKYMYHHVEACTADFSVVESFQFLEHARFGQAKLVLKNNRWRHCAQTRKYAVSI